MGILDFLGGLGKADAAPWSQRLTSGLGHQGGMLQQFGLGRYGNPTPQGPLQPGMSWQMGQGNNFADFLHGVGQAMGGPSASSSPQPQSPQPPPNQPQSPGLASLIQQWMQQNQRQ